MPPLQGFRSEAPFSPYQGAGGSCREGVLPRNVSKWHNATLESFGKTFQRPDRDLETSDGEGVLPQRSAPTPPLRGPGGPAEKESCRDRSALSYSTSTKPAHFSGFSGYSLAISFWASTRAWPGVPPRDQFW